MNSDVEYVRSDPRAQKIGVTNKDGTKAQYIAAGEIGVSTNVQPDIERLLTGETVRRMDCIDCHNRVRDPRAPPGDRRRDRLGQDLGQAALHQARGDRPPHGPVRRERRRRHRDRGHPHLLRGEYPFLASVWGARHQRRDRPAQAHLPLGRHARDARDGGHVSQQPRPPGNHRAASAATTAPIQGRQRRGHARGDPVRLRDVAHVPPDRLDPVRCPDRPAAREPRQPALGVRPQDDRLKGGPGGHDVRRLPHPDVLRELPRHAGRPVPHDNMVFNHAAVVQKTTSAACAYCHQPAYCAQCHSGDCSRVYPRTQPIPVPTIGQSRGRTSIP